MNTNEKQYYIYIRSTKEQIPVTKQEFDDYYRDINAFRRTRMNHKLCVCPQSQWLSCDIEKTFREGQAKQRLDDLFLHFISVAKRLRPKVVIAENVKGLINGNAKGWVNQIVKAFDDAGYAVQIFLFNSARMGVPQKRERVFFIAHHKDLHYPKLRMEFNSKPIPFSAVREPYGKALPEDNLSAKLMKYRIPSDRCLADINRRVRKSGSGFTSPINHDDEPVQAVTSGGYCFRIRHVLYNCSASRPALESQTKEENIEPGTEKLSITADPRGDGLVKARTGDSTTTTAYNGWYTSVYTPVAPTPPSGGST